MKKLPLLIIGVLVIAFGAMIVFAFQSGASLPNVTTGSGGESQGTAAEPTVKPGDVSVGIYDPAEQASAHTALLKERLEQLGFSVSIMREVASDETASERLTLLHQSGIQPKINTLKSAAFSSGVVRQIESLVGVDIVIAAWSIDDIKWGDLETQASALRKPDPSAIAVQVLNAGAESGEAGRIATILEKLGYTEVEATSADNEISGPSVIYYQRHFKTAAQALVAVLESNGYDQVTYRARQNQSAPIVIVLAKGSAE